MESHGGMILTGENLRIRRKTCPSATMSTTNPTWINPNAKQDLRVERPATNRLSHGMAKKVSLNKLLLPLPPKPPPPPLLPLLPLLLLNVSD
jgi:hypothetical protein